MKYLLSLYLLLFLSTTAMAEEKVFTAHSPSHRVSLFELYTSEGCSSCPPADRFISGLYKTGVSSEQILPLAFHVTYWDYIGWKDPFASAMHDQRQRKIAQLAGGRTVYTPQFVLNGSDYRDYRAFNRHVHELATQPSKVDISLLAKTSGQLADVTINTNSTAYGSIEPVYYLALYENSLVSYVKEGENEGVTLKHDYVVRNIYGPFKQGISDKTGEFTQRISFQPEWKRQDLGLVAYAQHPVSGEILQAVLLPLF